MKISFEPAARDELNDIFEWIAKDSPGAARRLIRRIEEKIGLLAVPNLAHLGRPGLVEEHESSSRIRTLSFIRWMSGHERLS